MNLPQLTELATVKDNTEQFAGYNHNLRNSVGEWYDQHNMTTDYYPVASPRDKRSLQTKLKNTEIIIDINEDNPLLFDSVYAKGCCALGYTDKMLISLQQIYDKDNNPIGAWFTNDGELVAIDSMYTEIIYNPMYNKPNSVIIDHTLMTEYMRKIACFEISDNSNRIYGRKRSIVRMGSYMCVLPDGMIYETANKEDAIPVFSISEKTDCSNVTFKTVVKNDYEKLGYSPIKEFYDDTEDAEKYRITDDLVQYYISGTNMWVSATTYVMIYVNGQTGTFDKFHVNEVLNIKNNSQMSEDTGILKGILSWDTQKKEYTEKSLKIIEKGTLAAGQMGVTQPTDYIIVDGYICQTVKKTKTEG